MYCPNCGKANSVEQRFCRSCGLNLEKTVQSLTEQVSNADTDKSLEDRKRKADLALTLLLGSALSIIVGGIFWAIIRNVIIAKGQVLGGSLFLAAIVCLILFGLLALYRESLLKASSKHSPMKSVQGERTADLLLDSHPEQMSSATENTTELLPVEKSNPTQYG